jgi:ribosomal protein S10
MTLCTCLQQPESTVPSTISTSSHAASSSTPNASSASSSIPNASSSIPNASSIDLRKSTCRTGTVNYITHSLPRQCLSRSSPTSNTTSTAAPTDDTTTSASNTLLEPTSTKVSPLSATQPDAEFETDSPLDNANFLSFEEWRKQNLVKVGQSPDHVGHKPRSAHDKAMPPINALDTLGDDAEIELDFGGFGRPSSSAAIAQSAVASEITLRSKDAGKTCKERSNYASFDCAATVLKSNPESKSASAVLIENKDSYMLNICSSSNKFLIVELCNDILIDTIVLANYEFFSSIFRTFRVSVSDRYPVKADRWKELGIFEARNTRSVQAFLVEQPLIWARYLRIEFLTHYGNEYYCPVSLLRVHGTTMMEEFRHQEELARGEISDDLEESVMPDALASPVQESPQSSEAADHSVLVESLTPIKSVSEELTVLSSDTSEAAVVETSDSTVSTSLEASSTSRNTHVPDSITPNSTSVQVHETSLSNSTPTPQVTANSSRQASGSMNTTSTPLQLVSINSTNLTASVRTTASTTASLIPTSATVSTHRTPQHQSIESSSRSALSNITTKTSTNASTSTKATNSSVKASSVAPDPQHKSSTSTVSSAHANPTTQESFFKSIHKRLQMLESNATLSLQYIEEQSRILRDAFMKVEKRQIKKTEAFLDNLNTTVFAELQGFRQEYDQLWQSTVIELENHRDQYQKEILAVSARLSVVTDELVFQKRMAIAQMTVLMICLSLVLFVRAGGGTSLDIPIIQQIASKSHFRRSSYYSPLNSPSPDQSSPPYQHEDARRRRGVWRSSVDSPALVRPTSRDDNGYHHHTAEEDSQEETCHPDNPNLRFEPPSPIQEVRSSDGEDGHVVSRTTASSVRDQGSFVDDGVGSEDELDGSTATPPPPQATQSSPPTPSGSRHVKMQAWPGIGGEDDVAANDTSMS